mgnify:CR=1 FL=1
MEMKYLLQISIIWLVFMIINAYLIGLFFNKSNLDNGKLIGTLIEEIVGNKNNIDYKNQKIFSKFIFSIITIILYIFEILGMGFALFVFPILISTTF